ncbi:hypothetical protein GIB67_026715 [Kingdonia uniflora]|uniref:Uncharacterized protein n=1 Tax=Kingdonia uniflora TaxID=39325 RepID=A0A7J7M2C1_9MAGN|nr:hypothetical protein GIB67_026715 [Kingdonia uniflora]
MLLMQACTRVGKTGSVELLFDSNVLVAFQHLAVIPKGEAMPSPDLQKMIDELTIKYEDAVKRLREKESFEAWRQAMKKKFQSGKLADKDNPTFIDLFD